MTRREMGGLQKWRRRRSRVGPEWVKGRSTFFCWLQLPYLRLLHDCSILLWCRPGTSVSTHISTRRYVSWWQKTATFCLRRPCTCGWHEAGLRPSQILRGVQHLILLPGCLQRNCFLRKIRIWVKQINQVRQRSSQLLAFSFSHFTVNYTAVRRQLRQGISGKIRTSSL